jgi:ABC-type nitrate/sulfonate/bicarbonate transport system substrate-binding protein
VPAAATAAPSASVALPKPEKTSITIGIGAAEPIFLALPDASQRGLFKNYGITDANVLGADTEGNTAKVLIAGQSDAAGLGAATTLSSLVTDTPLVSTAVTSERLTDALVTQADIKTPDQLRGKNMAISTFGGSNHASAILVLQAAGLKPEDVTLQQVGGESARLAALKAGAVSAAVIDSAREEELKPLGFNFLSNLTTAKDQFYPRAVVTFRKEWLKQNPNTGLAIMAAVLEAQNAIWADTDKAIQGFMTWAQVTDKADATARVKSFVDTGARDLRWHKSGWVVTRDVLATVSDPVKNLDVAQGYSIELLDKLRDLGFNQAIGLPKDLGTLMP